MLTPNTTQHQALQRRDKLTRLACGRAWDKKWHFVQDMQVPPACCKKLTTCQPERRSRKRPCSCAQALLRNGHQAVRVDQLVLQVVVHLVAPAVTRQAQCSNAKVCLRTIGSQACERARRRKQERNAHSSAACHGCCTPAVSLSSAQAGQNTHQYHCLPMTLTVRPGTTRQ